MRMGKIAGFGNPAVKMIYSGIKHRLDPNASLPEPFTFEVDEKYEENWGHGVSVFHNPKALIPLESDVFPAATHHYFQEDGQIVSYLADIHPYSGLNP
jgi:hypothetical protein